MLVVVLTTLLSVLLLMGALHIQFKPLAWTVAVALLATAVSVVHYVGPNPLGVAFLASAAWALLAWCALLPTIRFNKLIAKHKDLYILHHASRHTRRSLMGRSGHERHERLLRAMRRAARRTWKISSVCAAVVVLASAVGTATVLAKVRPRAFAPALERFESAWNAGDVAAVCKLFDARVRKVESARLTGLLAGHDWRSAPPQLGDARQRREEDRVFVDYDLADLEMSTSWVLADSKWSLVEVDLPVPRLQPELVHFRQAWEDSNPRTLASFFAQDAQERMFANIRGAAEKRGWASFPPIVDVEHIHDSRGRATVNFELGEGQLSTEWHFHTEGLWRVHSLRFPKR